MHAQTGASGAPRRFFSGVSRKIKRVAIQSGLAAMLAFTASCQKEFRVSLAAQESVHVGDTATLDGQAVGKVTRIENDGERNVAVVSVPRASAARIVVGTERAARNGLNFTTQAARPGAPPLASGKFIPTRTIGQTLQQSASSLADRLYRWISNNRKALLVVAVLALGLGLMLRMLSARFLVGLVLALIGLGFVASAAFSAPVRRAEIEHNLADKIEPWTSRAQTGLADAQRYVEAGLTNIADRTAAEAFLFAELATVSDEQTRSDLSRMSIFTAAETKAGLKKRYDDSAAQRARVMTELVQLKLPFLRLILLNRPQIRSILTKNSIACIPDLLQRLDKLSKLPEAVTRSLITILNVDDVRFEDGKLILPDGTQFQPAQAPPVAQDPTPRIANVERVAADLREALTALEEKVTKPASPREQAAPTPLTPEASVQIPETAAPQTQLPAAPAPNELQPPPPEPSPKVPAPSLPAAMPSATPPTAWLRPSMIVAFAVVLTLAATIIFLRGHPPAARIVTLATGDGSAQEMSLEEAEAIVLDAHPYSSPAVGEESQTRLVLTRRGVVVKPGANGTTVNGDTISHARRVTPGDVITAQRPEGSALTFTFISAVEAAPTIESAA